MTEYVILINDVHHFSISNLKLVNKTKKNVISCVDIDTICFYVISFTFIQKNLHKNPISALNKMNEEQ